jgi:hypothetical protein
MTFLALKKGDNESVTDENLEETRTGVEKTNQHAPRKQSPFFANYWQIMTHLVKFVNRNITYPFLQRKWTPHETLFSPKADQ